MKKKIYIIPSIRIVELKVEGMIAATNPSIESGGEGGPLVGDVKRYKPIIIDDEEDEEWEETTTAFSGRVFK